ncbi:MAG: GumC family protein [Kiritimatiellia bacterium]
MNTEPTSQIQQPQAEAVHFLDYWQILYARKEIVIAVSLLMILTGIVITRQMPRVYAATALIQVQREQPNIPLFSQTFYYRYDPIFLRTQFEIIKSSPVIEEVVREIRLDDEMGMAYGWKDTQTKATISERTVKLVQNKTALNIRRDTDLIEITVKFDKPEKPDGEAAKYAANVANTIAKVFRKWTQDKSSERMQDGLKALDEEIKKLDHKIAQAEEELAALRSKHNITMLSDIDTGTASIRAQIVQLTADKNNAQMVASLKKSKYEKIVELSPGEAAASLSILIGDNSLMPMLSDKQKLEMQILAHEQAGLGPQHPDVIQAKTLLGQLAAKIHERVADIKLGLRIDYEQSQSEFEMISARLAEETAKERELSSGVALDFEKMLKDLTMLRERRITLENRKGIGDIDLKMPTTSVEIIEEAKVPEIPLPISPNFALNVTLSVVAGIFFGIVLAFFVEYLDTTIKSVEDVEKYLATNVVGIIPQKIRALNDPSARPKHSEVYRVLRMNLKSSKKLGDGKLVMFTSASAGEGKSMTSFNLAHVCAEVGEKVLLVDADLHRPLQHKILNTENTPGLSNVIVGEATLDQAIQKTAQENMDFLPCGRISNASVYGLMDTDEMQAILAEVRKRYDRVILDAPPMIGVSDTAQLIRLADGVALVVQHRKYPRALCKRARDMITSMGGNLVGVILNNINTAHDYSSYYYEHQYYYYYYTNDSSGRAKWRSGSKPKGQA